MATIDMEYDESTATFSPPAQPKTVRPKTNFKPAFRRVEKPAHEETPPPPAASEYGERFRVPEFGADVLVPFAQIVVVGTLTLIAWLFVLPHIDQPRVYAIPIAAMTMLAQWIATLREERHRNPVVERVERSAEAAPVAAPATAPAEQPTRRIALTETHDNGAHKRTRLIDLPKRIDEKMPRVAQLVIVMNVNFSRPELHKRHKALTQGEFRTLLQTMRDAGLARVSAANHTELTPAGKSFLRGYLEAES